MSNVTVEFTIFDTVNFPGSPGLPIINEAPNEFQEDFPAIYGNVDFAFSVAFTVIDNESGFPLNIISTEVVLMPEFVDSQILAPNTVRFSVKPDVEVFPGEFFELLIEDQQLLTGSISVSSNTNLIEGFNTNFTEELEIGKNIIVTNTSERFTITDVINNTLLEVEQDIELETENSSFSLADISEIGVNDTINPGEYKTIFQWLDPPIKEISRLYTFVITYEDPQSIQGVSTVSTTHEQVFFWDYIPSLQKFDSLIAGSQY